MIKRSKITPSQSSVNCKETNILIWKKGLYRAWYFSQRQILSWLYFEKSSNITKIGFLLKNQNQGGIFRHLHTYIDESDAPSESMIVDSLGQLYDQSYAISKREQRYFYTVLFWILHISLDTFFFIGSNDETYLVIREKAKNSGL